MNTHSGRLAQGQDGEEINEEMNDTEQEDACTQQHNAATMLKRLPLLGAKPNPAVAVNGTPPLIKGVLIG